MITYALVLTGAVSGVVGYVKLARFLKRSRVYNNDDGTTEGLYHDVTLSRDRDDVSYARESLEELEPHSDNRGRTFFTWRKSQDVE